MPPFQQYSRINVQDLKVQMVKRVGPERANQYFNHFKGYISLRFSKTELDKLVVLTIGKENIGLHNDIIKAILINATKSDTPPPPSLVQDTSKPVKGVHRKPLLQFAISNDASRKSPVTGATPVWSNGAICVGSPKMERGLSLDQTINRDKGKILCTHIDGINCGVDMQRPSEHVQDAAEQSEAIVNDGSVHLCKRPRIIIPSSPDMGMSKPGGDPLSLSGVADSRYHRQWESEPVRMPPGTLFSSMSYTSTSKLPLFRLAGSSYLQLKDAEQDVGYSSDLPSAELVQRLMEEIAELEGLEGVSANCVELLNQGIDIFLKGLIQSCIDLVKSRSLSQQRSQWERQVCHYAANGPSAVEPYNCGGAQEELMREDLFQSTISFLDFKSAMDSNPQQLGHNWPLQLERLQLYCLE